MKLAELKEKIKDFPDNADVYIDDVSMPTPMGLWKVEYDLCNGFEILENGETQKFQVGVITLTAWPNLPNPHIPKKKKKGKKKNNGRENYQVQKT